MSPPASVADVVEIEDRRVPPVLRRRRPNHPCGSPRAGRPDQQYSPVEGFEHAAHRGRQVGVDDGVLAPGGPRLDEEPALGLRGGARQRQRPSPEPARGSSPASSRSASRRPSAGSIPSSASSDRTSASDRRRSRPGRADGPDEHVLGRVLELDELDELHVVADGPEQPGAHRVGDLGGEALPQEAVSEERRRDTAFSSCGASSCWQHGTARITLAPQRTARSSAASVAVSQACRLTTRSHAVEPRVAGDVADLEAEAVGAEPARERLALGDDVLLEVEPERGRPRGRGRA